MRVVGLCAAVALLVGCAGPGGEAPGSGGEAAGSGDLAATMEVKIGAEEVRLLLHVTNMGRTAREFTFPSSQRHDFSILTESGESVWHWSAARSFAQVVTTTRLEPGETWTFDGEWMREGRTGVYEARGWLATQRRRVEQRMMFELP